MDPLSKLLQRYCFAYTATHDFSVADQIMADDYTFYMGEHVFTGREAAYKPAAERQFQAYPGLGFAVHDFFSNGDRCAMAFSEYGHSVQYDADTAWRGVSLYRWNGQRLTECRIEQDYYARRRQLLSKKPDPVDQPAYAPWTAKVEKADPASEAAVSAWLKDGGLLKSGIGSLDDERVAPSIARVLLLNATTDVVDIMSAGKRVAFQIKMAGQYAGGLPELNGHEGASAALYATGFADVENGAVRNVRAVTDRYTMERRILAAAKKG
ncbi:MAG TPA: nuclear transport factor 2 family protein [Caulobacterales bacterium]|nr:nuclear transport factor 2 family protein [Caulobacterales bacterium]